jgi:hypothetical protein
VVRDGVEVALKRREKRRELVEELGAGLQTILRGSEFALAYVVYAQERGTHLDLIVQLDKVARSLEDCAKVWAQEVNEDALGGEVAPTSGRDDVHAQSWMCSACSLVASASA